MAFQPSVVEYFNTRKRPAVDDSKKVVNPSKVLVIEPPSPVECSNQEKSDNKGSSFAKKIVYKSKDVLLPTKKPKSANSKSSQSTLLKGKKLLKSDGSQMDIRKTLFSTSKNNEDKRNTASSLTQDQQVSHEDKLIDKSNTSDQNVPFHMKGALSPAKSKKTELEQDVNMESEDFKTEAQNNMKTPERSTTNSRKELNLGNIKKMMSRSSRLAEMKAALQRFNENKAKLDEMQSKTREGEKPISKSSQSVELEILPSPLKTPTKLGFLTSPQGKLTPSRLFASPPPPPAPSSPLKSPLKSPAFQRYQALVTEGKPALILPFKYRALAELFRCIDTVVSMIHNRRETVTLSKLRPGVQEISRKNLTDYHLGQIKTVFPNAFEFSIEKMRALGSAEKYELVITPTLTNDKKDGREGDHVMMGPNVMLARRRTLYNVLLELTKDHHEGFLMKLDPPMCIPRSRLTRWHPEFMVDDVPDIVSASLPQPPNMEKVTTAKDVLERARNLFVVNPRMERALQRVIENRSAAPALSPPSTDTTSLPSTTVGVKKPALHGVPAGLLERVRAKQAARALEAMTRSPAQAKEAVRLTRLPEIARILRNQFVTEKKSVLTREMVLKKLADSYRESLSLTELNDHLKLLAEKTPGWLTFCNLRKTDYVKLSRDADMSRIMTRLEQLAEEKCV